jgi:hypothetical protein
MAMQLAQAMRDGKVREEEMEAEAERMADEAFVMGIAQGFTLGLAASDED